MRKTKEEGKETAKKDPKDKTCRFGRRIYRS
jgi:hypothetical protein